MQTSFISSVTEEHIQNAAAILNDGGLVAFPTETVYGLGALATDADAVKKIFAAKGRPADNPLIIHIADFSEVTHYAREIPPIAKALAEEFWGGPLTMIFKKQPSVPDAVTAGLDTVAIRLPSHPIAYRLIKAAGGGIAAPSANTSGRPSPTTAADVKADMDGKIEMILDGGTSEHGVESTVLDLTSPTPRILRPGAVSLEMLLPFLPDCTYAALGHCDKPACPGMKYTHYAPDAKVFAVKTLSVLEVNRLAENNPDAGILALHVKEAGYRAAHLLSAGSTAADYAACLFSYLREADRRGIRTLYAVLPPPDGIGTAVINRLTKAAGGDIL